MSMTATKISPIAEAANFAKPFEVRSFPNGKVELVHVGAFTIGRATLEPGWRWSKSVKPIARTPSCEAAHLQYHVSGVLAVLMDDGQELTIAPGEVSFLPKGHDAWVVGREPVVIIDFQGMTDYACEE